jgi:GxxExxY protein
MVANNADKVIYRSLSYNVVGCLYDVFNELGPAHKEQVYQEALKVAFAQKGISFESNKKHKIRFRGKEIGVYEPDFVINNKIIVEIKSVLNMPKVFEKQLYYYLRSTDYKVGYLVNFGNEDIDIRRRVFDTVRKSDKNSREFALDSR